MSPRDRNKTRAITAAATIFFGLVAGLVVTEIALRIVKPAPLGIQRAYCEIRVPDREFGFRMLPDSTDRQSRFFEYDLSFRTNNLGFHDVDRSLEKIGGLRVLAVGDSYTASLHVPREQTWTQVAERRLNSIAGAGDSARKVEIINAGRGGSGTDVHLALMKKLMPMLDPDIVMLMYQANDIEDFRYRRVYSSCYKSMVLVYQSERARRNLQEFVDRHSGPLMWRFLVEHLFIARAVNVFTKWAPTTNVVQQSSVSIPWKRDRTDGEFARLFPNMKALAQSNDATLLIVPVPPKPSEGRSGESLTTVALSGSAAGIPVLDVRPSINRILTARGLRRADMFWALDGHHNVVGNEIFGLAVAEILAPYLDTQ